MTADERPFGLLMKEVRERLNMTQRELALVLRTAQSTISRVEKEGLAGKDCKVSHRVVKAFYQMVDNNIMHLQDIELSGCLTFSSPAICTDSRDLLRMEIKAACIELGWPEQESYLEALGNAEEDELVEESALICGALELRTKRELLAAAKASRQRWEAKTHEK